MNSCSQITNFLSNEYMTPQKKYLFIVNPISGDVDKSEIIEEVLNFASNKNFEIIQFKTTEADCSKEIHELYELHQPERVLVAGGDGTIKMVAEALEEHDVVFGILPAGSANGLALDLNLPDTIEEQLEIAFNGDFIAMDMVEINGLKSLHLSDIGLNAQLIKNYEQGNTRGKLGYALQAITTLIDADEPFSAIIQSHDVAFECTAKMIVIANSQKYGTGVTINPDSQMTDGKFEIVILKNLDLLVFGKIITGNMPVDKEDVEIISTDNATITIIKPVSFQVDGEYCGEVSELKVNILPGKMKVAIPEKAI